MKINDFADVAKTNPIKPNTNPIQTQFPKSQKMNVSSILTKDYENERLR